MKGIDLLNAVVVILAFRKNVTWLGISNQFMKRRNLSIVTFVMLDFHKTPT